VRGAIRPIGKREGVAGRRLSKEFSPSSGGEDKYREAKGSNEKGKKLMWSRERVGRKRS